LSLLDRLIAASVGFIPKSLVRRVAWRYVAGEDFHAAEQVAQRLEEMGCCATFDLLGEFVEDLSQADASVQEYRAALERIHEVGLDANVSVKLTAFGLKLDEEAAYVRVKDVVSHARGFGNTVRIDMEDSSCTDATFRIYRRLRDEGLDNVGIVLQAYLRRTKEDISELAALQPSCRLCKGIYVEPEAIAFQDDDEIRESYRAAMGALLDGGSYLGIATHDGALVEAGVDAVRSRQVPTSGYEFQMLLGVAENIRSSLVRDGHRVRVYIPYGRDWHAYCVRRLKENPRIGRYVFMGLFRRDS